MSNNERGFTLIELLIASAITSIIIFIVYFTFYTTSKAIEETKPKIDIYQEARVIFYRMEKEISSSFFSQQNLNIRFLGENVMEGESDSDRLDFVCTLNPIKIDKKESDLMEVGYYIKFEGNNKFGTLVRRYAGSFDSDIENGGEEDILGLYVKALNFRYYDGKDWQDSWDTNSKSQLPGLVEISITFYNTNNNSEYPLSTIVSLINSGEKK